MVPEERKEKENRTIKKGCEQQLKNNNNLSMCNGTEEATFCAINTKNSNSRKRQEVRRHSNGGTFLGSESYSPNF